MPHAECADCNRRYLNGWGRETPRSPVVHPHVAMSAVCENTSRETGGGVPCEEKVSGEDDEETAVGDE